MDLISHTEANKMQVSVRDAIVNIFKKNPKQGDAVSEIIYNHGMLVKTTNSDEQHSMLEGSFQN